MVIVFIAGHGRMVMGVKDKTVPDRITVKWAVPERFGSSPHVSRNMLVGRNNVFSEIAGPKAKYNEHWLMPDGCDNMTLKAKDMRKAVANMTEGWPQLPHPAENYWLLQPRGLNAVPLSAILDCLKTAIPGTEPIEVRWTCCRSPVGQTGSHKMEIHDPWTTYVPVSVDKPHLIEEPGGPGDFVTIQGEDKDVIERFKIEHTCTIKGTVTLVQVSKKDEMNNPETWPGTLGVV